MKAKPDYLLWNDAHVVSILERALQAGHVVATTTDTVVGLMACATQEGAFALDRIKMRERKPYILLAHDTEQLKNYVHFPDDVRLQHLMQACWPGPLTLILPIAHAVRQPWAAELKGIAVRIPDHAGLQAITRMVGPVFSTSANKSGEPVCRTIAQLHPDIKAAVSLLIDDAHADDADTVASTILDCTHDEPRVVREGCYPIAELERIWGKPFKRA